MTPSDRLAIRVPNLGLARGFLADAAVRGTTRIPQAILPRGIRPSHQFGPLAGVEPRTLWERVRHLTN